MCVCMCACVHVCVCMCGKPLPKPCVPVTTRPLVHGTPCCPPPVVPTALCPGTYTPFLLVNLRDKFAGRVVLVFVWVLAFAGVFTSTFLAARFRKHRTYFYGVIGWCAVVAYRSILACVRWNGVLLLAAGGLSYTVGAGFYIHGSRVSQTTTYVCALVGTACHYFAVYLFVEPSQCTDSELEAWFAPLQRLFDS
jgi:hypothetical protein